MIWVNSSPFVEMLTHEIEGWGELRVKKINKSVLSNDRYPFFAFPEKELVINGDW